MMKMKKIFCVSLFAAILMASFSLSKIQAAETEQHFESKIVFDLKGDVGDIIATSDGNAVITGFGQVDGSYGRMLLKVNANGEILWKEIIAGSGIGISAVETSDRNIAVCTTGGDVFCFDKDGNSIWHIETDCGYHNNNGCLADIANTEDGSLIVTGCINTSDKTNVYLEKISLKGEVIFKNNNGTSCDVSGETVEQTMDGGYIVAASNIERRSKCTYLFKFDQYGHKVWNEKIDSEWIPKDIKELNDGTFIIAGGSVNERGVLCKTSATGSVIWIKFLNDDMLNRVEVLQDGFLVFGSKLDTSRGFLEHDLNLIKCNMSGEPVWSQSHSENPIDRGKGMTKLSDGSYFLLGETVDNKYETHPILLKVLCD